MTKREVVQAGLIVLSVLLIARAMNVPDEAPYLGWGAILIWAGIFAEIAYNSSKRW